MNCRKESARIPPLPVGQFKLTAEDLAKFKCLLAPYDATSTSWTDEYVAEVVYDLIRFVADLNSIANRRLQNQTTNETTKNRTN
jgi:hypothetical protein